MGAPPGQLGVLFLSFLLNWFLFGLVTQQLYSYWIGGFNDKRPIKTFVIVQYGVVTLQCIMNSLLVWNLFILGYCCNVMLPVCRLHTWPGPVASVCQCFLIVMANMVLAHRVYTLTGSRLQSGWITVLSVIAVSVGLCALIVSWTESSGSFNHFTPEQNGLAVTWHVLQFICECFISGFLIRALSNSRVGFEKSNNLIRFFTRRVIQLGLFAMIWSLAAMGTWFLMPKYNIYAFFDLTSGSVYTHMIFDTLISRMRLRERMAEGSNIEMGLSRGSQSRSQGSEGQQKSLQIPHGKSTVVAMPSRSLTYVKADESSLTSVIKEDSSD